MQTKNVCVALFAAGFSSSSQCTQRTVDHYPYYEFIPKLINLCYAPFRAIVELFKFYPGNDVILISSAVSPLLMSNLGGKNKKKARTHQHKKEKKSPCQHQI